MKRIVRDAVIMMVALVCMIAFLSQLNWLFNKLIIPARGETVDVKTLCAVAQSLLTESGGDIRAAEKLARERGFTSRQIWAAKKLCK